MLLLSDLDDLLFEPFEKHIRSDAAVYEYAARFEALARKVAANMDDRIQCIEQENQRRYRAARERPGKPTSLWDQLEYLWKYLEGCFNVEYPRSSGASDQALIFLATMVAKFEMNMIAGIYDMQENFCITQYSQISNIIFNITNFTRIEDPQYFRLQAMLTQLVSNIVSPISTAEEDNEMVERVYANYTNGERRWDTVTRLLDSPDPKVMLATLRYIHNVLRNSLERQQGLMKPTGVQWLPRILSRMDDWLDSPPEDRRFEVACSIFDCYLFNGTYGILFEALNPNMIEVVTPAQTALLKLVDAHITHRSSPNSNWDSAGSDLHPDDFLLDAFSRLHKYASISLTSGLDDARLPKILEAMVLVVECLGTIALAWQARRDQDPSQTEDDFIVTHLKSPENKYIQSIISLLRSLKEKMPDLRRPSADTSTAKPVSNKAPTERSMGGIKASLVRLLGTLTYDDTAVGDQVRGCQGIEVILGLTEVDEHNPYLREHALLCIRNLMLNNPANQAILKEMGPVGVLSQTGEVLPVPERMKNGSNGNGTNHQ